MDISGSSDDAEEEYILNEDESESELVRGMRKAGRVIATEFWRVEAKGLIAGVLNPPRYSCYVCTFLIGS